MDFLRVKHNSNALKGRYTLAQVDRPVRLWVESLNFKP